MELNIKQILNQAENNEGCVSGLVELELNELLDSDTNEFLKLLEGSLVGFGGVGLQEIDYSIAGHRGATIIIFNVSGYLSEEDQELLKSKV